MVGSTKPAIMFRSVDLPQPDGPSRQVKLFSAQLEADLVERRSTPSV